MTDAERFWNMADELVATSEIVVDHPRGSRHPQMPETVFPFDYGYLKDTKAMDGGGIDVWRGSIATQRVTGAIVTADIFKRDTEVKLLVGCTPKEAQLALATHNNQWQAGFLILRSPLGRFSASD